MQVNPPDDLLVGTATGDDAAVWRIDDDRALISTVDFITPVVDDARTWGRVAAANSVSDVYAMGGRPLFALNLVGWNTDVLPTDLLGELLAGGQDIAAAGGFAVVGGHTIDDPEPKYGLSVTGEVHPDHILTNAGLGAGPGPHPHQTVGHRGDHHCDQGRHRVRHDRRCRRRVHGPAERRGGPRRTRPRARPVAPMSPDSGCWATSAAWPWNPASAQPSRSRRCPAPGQQGPGGDRRHAGWQSTESGVV